MVYYATTVSGCCLSATDTNGISEERDGGRLNEIQQFCDMLGLVAEACKLLRLSSREESQCVGGVGGRVYRKCNMESVRDRVNWRVGASCDTETRFCSL